MHLGRRAIVLGLFLGQATAILVADNSPCQGLCGNVLDATTVGDVVCREEDYGSSAEGIVFQQCTSCQLRSDYTTGIEHDTQWLLCKFCEAAAPLLARLAMVLTQSLKPDNLRYAVSYCLFGYPENDYVTSSPCLTR